MLRLKYFLTQNCTPYVYKKFYKFALLSYHIRKAQEGIECLMFLKKIESLCVRDTYITKD